MLVFLLFLCGPLSAVLAQQADNSSRSTKGNCVLPAYPDHGTYVTNLPDAKPGEAYEFLLINVTCHKGFGVEGSRHIACFNGFWAEPLPKCVSLCHLSPHPSVEYHCLIKSGDVEGIRPCKEFELSGTVVSPRCRTPNYFSPTALQFMRCIDGTWDYVAICSPECGTVTPTGVQLILDGEASKQGEVPWHAGIYTKTTSPYMQICAGSLISSTIVISAAHCFWNEVEGQQPASKYAVAVGKLYRPWDNTADAKKAQRSDVKEIHLPTRFQGSAANYQDDIAVVIASDTFEFKPYIRPVCIDFDITFERRQLQPGRYGKVAGWGLTPENGKASRVLKDTKLPYISVENCIAGSPPGLREYITSDKICAGEENTGKALCRGDAGGGLAFPESDRGTPRYYLRGVVSTAPNNDNLCNANAYTFFTQVLKHEHFIKQFWGSNL